MLHKPYLLMTPGPLSTTRSVKEVMLMDWCTWDDDYKLIVEDIRGKLVNLASAKPGFTSVLMQGSGTFSVESVISSVIPRNGKLLVLTNGGYGDRIVKMAGQLNIEVVANDSGDLKPPDTAQLRKTLESDPAITHVAVVHCETTTGMLNPIEPIAELVKGHDKVFIVDAMSSFGGIPMDMEEWQIDFLISSANKCIQGVPGFGFVLARRKELEKCRGRARSLSLDLYDQWNEMEENKGKWRYTSPTHTVQAFGQALKELEEEGGIKGRHARYQKNQSTLVEGMESLGFECLLRRELQSPFITSFLYPRDEAFTFQRFYDELKARGFVIYPGKVTTDDTFRIGNIGDIDPEDILVLIEAVKNSMYWKRTK
jgi:2-aminoethylphosphonate-pyruvate transaminase